MNRFVKAAGCLGAPLYLRALARAGVAAGWEHERILRACGCATVVDVGANRGQFALAVRRALPQARVVSFEPLTSPASTFRRLFAGDARVTLHVAAIGPRRERAAMHVSARDDSSSLLPIGEGQTRLFPGTGEVGTETVEVGPLEDYLSAGTLQPPALLKIDVQGYELETLRGCEGLLPEFDLAYVECSFVELYRGQPVADEVIAWLRERGMPLAGVHNLSRDGSGRAVQADFLFRRRRPDAAGG